MSWTSDPTVLNKMDEQIKKKKSSDLGTFRGIGGISWWIVLGKLKILSWRYFSHSDKLL